MGFLCRGDDLAIDKTMISDIKNSINIVDIIGEVVDLTKSGRNYLGLCPFHQEKTPSFNVIEDKQFYHCFGCGKSGDVFKFLEEYHQITFLESVKILGERSGFSISSQSLGEQVKKKHPHQIIFELNKDAAKFYHAVLMTTTVGQKAKEYLYERGLTDELITYFNIGLAPDETNYLFQSISSKYEEKDLTASGLFNISDSNQLYDAFRNRIMFPLTDDSGNTIGFSGRIWTKEEISQHQAKYKNTRSTPFFNKSYELYHLDKAKAVIKKTDEVYIMEGFMDVIAAYRSGIKNAVASMGTALTTDHVRHLKKFAKRVILTYDGDSAGQEAITKALDILSDLTVEIVKMPQQMDPDEFVKKYSEQELVSLLEQSRISSIEFLMQFYMPKNSDNLQAEISYVDQMAQLIAKEKSITAQNTYIYKLAERLPDFDYLQIEQVVNNYRLTQRSSKSNARMSLSSLNHEIQKVGHTTGLLKAENQLFHRLIHHEHLLNAFRNRDDFKFETTELQFLYGILKEKGEITTLDLDQLTDSQRQAYYQVLEENLPDEIAENEIEEIEERRNFFLREQDLKKQSQFIRESSNQGDIDSAISALEALIEQKRHME
ncbi:DNA primase [Streptococcus sp. CSL10205-OR2]|uniref:DNA primase n=1 Tax=Streptococcus sp. CSL10205-OR2 TaxID=2980558 RepID=UPI002953ACAB|nr:DNA primase [Streptococcus sp. CSL10205-OR2]